MTSRTARLVPFILLAAPSLAWAHGGEIILWLLWVIPAAVLLAIGNAMLAWRWLDGRERGVTIVATTAAAATVIAGPLAADVRLSENAWLALPFLTSLPILASAVARGKSGQLVRAVVTSLVLGAAAFAVLIGVQMLL